MLFSNKYKANKKKIVIVLISLLCIGNLSGCSQSLSNPMEYFLSQDEAMENASKKETLNDNDASDNNNSFITGDNSNSVKIIELSENEYTSKEMVKLSLELNSALSDSDCKGAVIIINESNIEDIGYFLQLTIKQKKPVVLLSDKDKSSLNDNITKAKELIKNGENEAATANAITTEYKTITGLGNDAYDLTGVIDLPEVSIIYDYPGNDSTLLQKAINISEGIVVVTTSKDGSLSNAVNEILEAEKSLPVMICELNSETGSNIEKLTPNQMRIKLQLSIN